MRQSANRNATMTARPVSVRSTSLRLAARTVATIAVALGVLILRESF